MRILIEAISRVNDELVEAFIRLSPQLSETRLPPNWEQLAEIVASPATTILVARLDEDNHHIIGTLTLAVFRTPAGVIAYIEDVVVDEAERGKGVGEALTRVAIELAAQKGAVKVDLTSAPWREAANRLYQRLGFVHWDTNFYRYIIKK